MTARASTTYALHGLTVRSELALDGAAIPDRDPDIEITFGERRPIRSEPPEGELLSELTQPGAGSSLTRDADGYVWRAYGVCEFVTDPARRRVRLHLAPGVDEELASMLAVTFLSRMLVLDGHLVLHASGVAVADQAIAIIGHSGSGKSTIAALCCAAGAELLSDDALRIAVRDGTAYCYRGSGELRLRPQAAALAEAFSASGLRTTLDGRTAVRPAQPAAELFELAALVAPRLSPPATEIRVERLQGAAAVIELMRFPRTLGWTDIARTQHNLDALTRLVESLSVLAVELPWNEASVGPALARELLDRVFAMLSTSRE
ncbi:MAG: hypothetical protein ABSC56_01780 [Solirubrobacteraceae bacterium]|jgi:hypothetical protein